MERVQVNALSDLADAIRHQTDAINALIESNQAMLDYLISLETYEEEEEEGPQVVYLDGGMY